MKPKLATGLEEVVVNGQPCHAGFVQFIAPNKRRHLLNPFVKFMDSDGNRFFVGGLRGALIAVYSAKLNEPVPVTCVKAKEGEFVVTRFDLDWIH